MTPMRHSFFVRLWTPVMSAVITFSIVCLVISVLTEDPRPAICSVLTVLLGRSLNHHFHSTALAEIDEWHHEQMAESQKRINDLYRSFSPPALPEPTQES